MVRDGLWIDNHIKLSRWKGGVGKPPLKNVPDSVQFSHDVPRGGFYHPGFFCALRTFHASEVLRNILFGSNMLSLVATKTGQPNFPAHERLFHIFGRAFLILSGF